MRHQKSIFISASIIALLAGCSSPKDASKDNFKKVINNYLEKSCVKISPRKNGFPVTIKLRPEDTKWAIKENADNIRQYEALVSVGVLELKEGTAQEPKNMFSTDKITVKTKTYSLTKKGKDAFFDHSKESSLDSSFAGFRRGFCVATYEVNEVTNFSEPSQAMGYTISNVNYSYSPRDIKDWATQESIQQAFPRLAKELAENQKRTATLVLMSDGWIHEKEMKN